MKNSGQLEFSIVGSPDNVRKGIFKIKSYYQKVSEIYLEDQDFLLNGGLSDNDELLDLSDEFTMEK